jgi:hypothetical protein
MSSVAALRFCSSILGKARVAIIFGNSRDRAKCCNWKPSLIYEPLSGLSLLFAYSWWLNARENCAVPLLLFVAAATVEM